MDVLKLASLGWRLIAMQRATKNPGSLVGEDWPSKATSDPATVKAWSDLGLNFGVLLGPSSGVIDVEYDSDEGREILKDAEPTLAYKSAKSVHRIYLYDERFIHEKAKVGINGTEWRFGQDKAQSVIPPSLHENGADFYEWIDVREPVRLPDAMWELYQRLKASDERHKARERPQDVPPRDRTGDSLIDLARAEAEKLSWESLLTSQGWTFVRNRGEAQDWLRPGKKSGTISATVNYGGTGTLRVFSTNCSPLVEDSSYDKFAFICVTEYEDDPIAAAKGILPQAVQDELDRKWREGSRRSDGFDPAIFMKEREPDIDDEEFCQSMIPPSGLITEVAKYVSRSSYRPSPVLSLATSISLCQTIFGRKIKSETGMRTNDFHLVLAPTCTGKEGPLNAMTELLHAAGHVNLIMPSDQSGPSSLLDCLEAHPQHIQNWVCDEFGYVLAAVLDKKSKEMNKKGIAKKLLELYSKSGSMYSGSAFSGKKLKHAMMHPHLCAFSVSTGYTVFKEICEDQVHDGLLGRVSFWNLQRKPKPNRLLDKTLPTETVETIKAWVEFEPPGSGNLEPKPVTVPFSSDARARWQGHEDAIDRHSEQERAMRAAMWGRTAARSMKLALTHRLARLSGPQELNEFNAVQIEIEDVDWAIAISNHCTRLACSLLRETVSDTSGNKLAEKVLAIVKNAGDGISRSELNSRLKSSDSGSIWAAVSELSDAKVLRTWSEPTKGRPKIMVAVVRGENLA